LKILRSPKPVPTSHPVQAASPKNCADRNGSRRNWRLQNHVRPNSGFQRFADCPSVDRPSASPQKSADGRRRREDRKTETAHLLRRFCPRRHDEQGYRDPLNHFDSTSLRAQRYCDSSHPTDHRRCYRRTPSGLTRNLSFQQRRRSHPLANRRAAAVLPAMRHCGKRTLGKSSPATLTLPPLTGSLGWCAPPNRGSSVEKNCLALHYPFW
jgi:hypothetical protein